MKKEKIIYIFPKSASFIEKDIQMLSIKYEVVKSNLIWEKPIKYIFIKQIIFLIKNIRTSKAILIMFGGYWSLAPSIFGYLLKKPVYIILGGTDCVSFPNIHYGSLRKPLLKKAIYYSFKFCKKLLPVDKSLVYNQYSYCENTQYSHQGFQYFFPNLKTPYQVIHNGFNPSNFNIEINNKVKNSFIVISSISNQTRFLLKGIDKVLKLAEQFENCKFSIIGMSKSFLLETKINIPENVFVYPEIHIDKFKNKLTESEFILQLSISEGFPNALCEGMLCGCIPIGSSVGAIPNIIGDTGFIVKKSQFELISDTVNTALKLNAEHKKTLALKARERIIENFHISKREKQFIELIESVK